MLADEVQSLPGIEAVGVVPLEQGIEARTKELSEANDELLLLRHALDSAPTAIGLADLKGRMRYVNPALAELWGLESPQAAVGRRALEFFELLDASNTDMVRGLRKGQRWDGELDSDREFFEAGGPGQAAARRSAGEWCRTEASSASRQA